MSPRTTRPVPISEGCSTAAEFELGPFRITRVEFDGGCRIDPHYHDRPNIGVILEGSFDLSFGSRLFECKPGTLFIEPAGETHCNCMGRQGARVLALQPDPHAAHLSGSLIKAFDAPRMRSHPHSLHVGRRIARECSHFDEYTALMVQGLAYELVAEAARLTSTASTSVSPALDKVEHFLVDEHIGRTTLTALANEAGVHTAHLARTFRMQYGRSLGGFLLERRLEWAARELAETHRSISEIALDAGFADQSHFTRRFRAYAGETPRKFRLRRTA